MEVKGDLETWLDLWAQHCRHPGVNSGYPKQVPWYTEPKKYADDSSPEDNIWFDHWMADQIATAVLPSIERREPLLVSCLKEFYGAYPSASGKRGARIGDLSQRSGMSPREIYRNVETARQQITGALDQLKNRA